MITNFSDVKILTRNITTYPITVDDVKSYSKYFRKTSLLNTSQDAFIAKMIARVIDGWESETGFLLLDQTLKTSLYNQLQIYPNFKGRLTRLNIRSFGDILYHPCTWNTIDAKEVLSTDIYYITPEVNTTPAIFQLKDGVCSLDLYPVYNNLEITLNGGYEDNDFTNMPQDIRDCLIMQCSDIVDVDNDICGCDGFYSQEVKRIYKKYTAFTTTISL